MKIGLVGSGGREHAIAIALAKNNFRDELYVFASHLNPGIQSLTKHIHPGVLTDTQDILDYFQAMGVDYVVIGPEAPLMTGAVNALRKAGIPTIGATKSQARIEGSKAFMRQLLQEQIGWGSPQWRVVTDRVQAANFIERVGMVAVKPIGLTGGKGVQVMGVHLNTLDETLDIIDYWIKNDGKVLLEERLVGEEFSRMAFVSDNVIIHLPLAQDFKYAYDNDQGGMTGGMGSYTFADGLMPFLKSEDLMDADRLLQETINALVDITDENYRGFLYGQFMITKNGIRVIEYNARLGDPEAINEMLLLEADPAQVFYQIALGELENSIVHFKPKASLCKYLVPAGYPQNPGEPLTFSIDEERIKEAGFAVIYASVISQTQGKFRTLGSRTLAIAGLGPTPGEISEDMEALLSEIEPEGLRHRKDVGDANVIAHKIEKMKSIRRET